MRILSPSHQALIEQTVGLRTLQALPSEWCILDVSEPIPTDVLPHQCIGLVSGSEPEDIIASAAVTGYAHLISIGHPFFQAQLLQAFALLGNKQSLLQDPLNILLDPGLTIVGATANNLNQTHLVTNTEEKTAAIDQLRDHLSQHKPATTICDNAISIADELLMNAIYDAPQASAKSQAAPAELFWGYNSHRLVLGVCDYYGSLNTPVMLQRLHKVYAEGVSQTINLGSGPGGAGIGMRIVFDQCSSLYIAVQRGHKTVICCALNLGRSRRTLQSEQKSLHIHMKNSV